LRAGASRWEPPTLQDICALEIKEGSGNRVRKNSIRAQRRDGRGRKNWVGDEKPIRENLTSEKEMEGGRGRGFLGWCCMGEANLGFIKSLGFGNQTLFCQFVGFQSQPLNKGVSFSTNMISVSMRLFDDRVDL